MPQVQGNEGGSLMLKEGGGIEGGEEFCRGIPGRVPRLSGGLRRSGSGDREGRGGSCLGVFHSGERISRLIVLYSIRECPFVVILAVATSISTSNHNKQERQKCLGCK